MRRSWCWSLVVGAGASVFLGTPRPAVAQSQCVDAIRFTLEAAEESKQTGEDLDKIFDRLWEGAGYEPIREDAATPRADSQRDRSPEVDPVAVVRAAERQLARFAESVEADETPWAAYSEVTRYALDPNTPVDVLGAMRGELARVRDGVELRCLFDSTDRLMSLCERGQWATVQRAAQADLARLPRTAPDEAAAAYRYLSESASLLERHVAIRDVLQQPLDDWGEVGRDVPEELRRPAEALVALAALKSSGEGAWTNGVPKAQLLRDLAVLGRTEEVAKRDVDRTRLSFSFKAFLQEDFRAANELLPDSADAEDCQCILRDLKAVAAGKGQLASWPAQALLLREQRVAHSGPRGPPLIAPKPDLVGGVQGAIAEAATRGLPVWEAVHDANTNRPLWKVPRQAEQPLRDSMAESLDRYAPAQLGSQVQQLARNARRLYLWRLQRYRNREEEPGDGPVCLFEVEKLLGRKLTLDERFLAMRLCLEKRTPKDVVDQLQSHASASIRLRPVEDSSIREAHLP